MNWSAVVQAIVIGLPAMDWGIILSAIIASVPASLIGVLAYRRSRVVDAVAAQSGVITETRAGVEQVIEGQNDLIDRLQTDNKLFRDDLRALTQSVAEDGRERDRERDELKREIDALKKQVSRLRRKYGENTDDELKKPPEASP